jgi:hypothetical protein
MKCSGSFPCERCIRVGRECKLPEQAVRQPWSRKKDLEIAKLKNRLNDMERKLDETSGLYPSEGSEASPSTSSLHRQPSSAAALTSDANNIFDNRLLHIDDNNRGFHLPFVSSGRILPEEAKELFDLFMQNCVLHVALVDPEWHSYTRVSSECPFLFACVVYIASSYHHKRFTWQEELRPEMNDLIGRVVSSGEKSISIVQGFLFLYFFNQPPLNAANDTAWLYSGIAIRIASELNLGSTNKQVKESPRQRIDRERTWMMTFVVDRSLSTTRGKAWTIRGDDSIVRNLDSWYTQPTSRMWDIAISTLADLLKVTSRQIDALNTSLSAKAEFSDSFDCETMMRIMNEELEEWRRKWHMRGINIALTDDRTTYQGNDVHERTYHYLSKQGAMRYNYAVLVLNCFGLQYCASNPSKSAARTYSLTQAIQAAQNVVNAAKDGLQNTVAYSPYSQCTILTFAIVSLIKLASLKRDDHIVSQRLLGMVESGIAFLESVAIRPTHVAARSASFLRGLLRKSLMGGGETGEATFRPGMETHSLPAQSSRPSTPNESTLMTHQQYQQQHQHNLQHQHVPIDPQLQDPHHSFHQSQTQQQTSPLYDTAGNIIDPNAMALPWGFVDSMLANTDPSLLFSKEGSTGFGALTADEILNDSFWLRMPERSPTRSL